MTSIYAYQCPAKFLSAFVITCIVAVSFDAGAQSTAQAKTQQPPIDWYYSAVFGTGAYRFGNQTVGVVQLPLSYKLRAATEEYPELILRLPVSLGFYNFSFSELISGTIPRTLSTLTVFPGLEIVVPVSSDWRLTPYVSLGRGWETSGRESAWIYDLGTKSRLRLASGTDYELSLGNQLTLAGYNGTQGANHLGLFVAGLNLATPSRLQLFRRPSTLDFHLIYYLFYNRTIFPVFPPFGNTPNTVLEQGEFGISLATRTPTTYRQLYIDRMGLAFRVGGGTKGIRLLFSLPY
jgi:hypothetical protein